ncbi:PREDICTED: squamous cell carcinoma antigen recognized by T-cells 3-like [Cyphomyrmex costatus]|uniref:Squamous cell carcinoma antigen recognized by T-cells 3 n=1 Tax=Cyphomyrmex costatus TaxID=456900 RepID=A0A151ID41_9HYME|nr:PREDICTED: squamous cell carcinoma antigen recognized by T-cells 3-like [Cyphomyrmex costatus]KYM98312.1 Squamous cell carcinoma antigen recognized by T-cells 3 [Cyphomyrmex costatus]
MDEEMDAVNEEVPPGEASDEEEMVTSETEEQADTEVVEIESESDDDDDEDDDYEDAKEAEVKALEASLSKNPYDYSSHVALIDKLHTMGELDRLRAARNNMSTIYPLSSELWLAWISDEIKLATTDDQKTEIVKLCERAIQDYLSVEVWLEYLQFSIGYMGKDEEKVRQLFERALVVVGTHVTKGAIIWEAYREYENIIFASLLSLDDDTEKRKKKAQLERIISLFKRQLSNPLLDMDKTYEEYQSWCTKYDTEVDTDEKSISKCYKQSSAKLTLFLPYEEKLVSAQNQNELLDAYKGYLLYIKQNNPDFVKMLYERAITDLNCLETSIWLDYITYLENESRLERELDSVYQRASRNIPWCAIIWQKWMRSYEKWDKHISEIQTLLENALSAGFSTAEDYRNLWITYLECLRRRLDQYPDEERDKYLNVVRKTFNRACEHLAKYFGLDGDPNCVILQYWARFEAIHADNMEQTRRLWADILSQEHSATASYWLEYIILEKSYGDSKHLRKLYQKALSSTQDWPESIANSWIDFERDKGTLEQMEFCEEKTKEKLDKIMTERQKAQQILSQSELSTQDKKMTSKRKVDDGKWKNLGSSPSKIVKTDVRMKPKLRANIFSTDRKTTNDQEKSKLEVVPPPGYKTTEDKDMDDKDSQHEVDDNITIFVSNLDYTTTEDEVRDVLKSIEPITLFRMIKDYKGRSKGYCYIQLSSTEAVKEALKLDRTTIKGRPMFISKCDSNRNTRSSVFKYSSILEKNKLFVKGLPLTMTKEQLEEIFKVHGDLKEVRLVTYRNGHSKGLAYVEYHDEATAAKALLSTDGMKVEDKVINVAISQPPDRKKMQTEENAEQVKSLGGTSTSRTTFGVPKTLLSMVPRNVKKNTNNGSAASNGNHTQSMSNQDFRNMFLNKK